MNYFLEKDDLCIGCSEHFLKSELEFDLEGGMCQQCIEEG